MVFTGFGFGFVLSSLLQIWRPVFGRVERLPLIRLCSELIANINLSPKMEYPGVWLMTKEVWIIIFRVCSGYLRSK